MGKLTITVDADTLRRARMRALERDESVNAYLAEMLRRYADRPASTRVVDRLAEIADAHRAGSSGNGRTWTRDHLHRV